MAKNWAFLLFFLRFLVRGDKKHDIIELCKKQKQPKNKRIYNVTKL